jgi:hypothetical protein
VKQTLDIKYEKYEGKIQDAFWWKGFTYRVDKFKIAKKRKPFVEFIQLGSDVS